MIGSYEEFLSIIWDIEDDSGLLKQAQEYVSKLSKRANVRLKALETEGFENTESYKRAERWLQDDGRRRFTESKKLDAESLRAQAHELNAFLTGGSTITEERDRRAGFDKLMPNATRAQKNMMRRFLMSSAFEEMKKTIGTDIVKKAADAIESGASVAQLNKLYERFLNQEKIGDEIMDITDVWTMWIGE